MTEDLSVDIDHELGTFRLDCRFDAPRGVTALFGRSGSGKSTLINIIAGLVRPRRGRVRLGGRVLLDTDRNLFVACHRRRIGYVFQEGRLLPHLTVRQNLLFGHWFAPRRAESARLGDVVDLLGISTLMTRRPGALSGGEKQRVAIGRALLSKPRLLLMDEPLAALDDDRKAEILPYIERLRDEATVPIVYVSHSVAEVARLADTLVVIEGGRVTACGPAASVMSSSLAGLRAAGAMLEAAIAGRDDAFGLTRLSTPAGALLVALIERPVGTRLRLQILARDVMLSLTRPEGLSALNVLAGIIMDIPAQSSQGGNPAVDIRLDCSGAPLLARITRKSVSDLGLAPGMAVYAVVKSVALERERLGETRGGTI